jgi:hypothetical protein
VFCPFVVCVGNYGLSRLWRVAVNKLKLTEFGSLSAVHLTSPLTVLSFFIPAPYVLFCFSVSFPQQDKSVWPMRACFLEQWVKPSALSFVKYKSRGCVSPAPPSIFQRWPRAVTTDTRRPCVARLRPALPDHQYCHVLVLWLPIARRYDIHQYGRSVKPTTRIVRRRT